MMAHHLRWVWLLAALGTLPAAFADNTLRHDPFARPVLTATAAPAPGGPPVPASQDVPWAPTLSAVMVAGKQSMVTVDDTIVTLGEVIDGHRLIRVTEHEAVFQKGKKRIVLTIQASTLRQNQERAAE